MTRSRSASVYSGTGWVMGPAFDVPGSLCMRMPQDIGRTIAQLAGGERGLTLVTPHAWRQGGLRSSQNSGSLHDFRHGGPRSATSLAWILHLADLRDRVRDFGMADRGIRHGGVGF